MKCEGRGVSDRVRILAKNVHVGCDVSIFLGDLDTGELGTRFPVKHGLAAHVSE